MRSDRFCLVWFPLRFSSYHFVLLGQLYSPMVCVASEYPKYELLLLATLMRGCRCSRLKHMMCATNITTNIKSVRRQWQGCPPRWHVAAVCINFRLSSVVVGNIFVSSSSSASSLLFDIRYASHDVQLAQVARSSGSATNAINAQVATRFAATFSRSSRGLAAAAAAAAARLQRRLRRGAMLNR